MRILDVGWPKGFDEPPAFGVQFVIKCENPMHLTAALTTASECKNETCRFKAYGQSAIEGK